MKLVNIWPNCLRIVNNVMKFYIYLWGYIFVPFIQINLHYFNTDLSCLQVCFLAGPSNLSCLEKPTFYQLVFLWSLSIKSLILYIYRLSGMNGIIIFFTVLLLLYLLYFVLQFIAWYQSRNNRIQRGTIGLPDADSSQEPRTYCRIFGDICYTGLRFCCRMFPQH